MNLPHRTTLSSALAIAILAAAPAALAQPADADEGAEGAEEGAEGEGAEEAPKEPPPPPPDVWGALDGGGGNWTCVPGAGGVSAMAASIGTFACCPPVLTAWVQAAPFQ